MRELLTPKSGNMIRLLFSLGFIIALAFALANCQKDPPDQPNEPYINSYCDSLEAAGIFDNYIFPVGYDAHFQIPNESIIQMCTHGLVETVFKWRFLKSITFYTSYQSWWITNTQPIAFNGIKELAKRLNGPNKVYNRFMEFDEYPYSDTITSYTVMKDIETRLTFMEVFLAQEDIMNRLSDSEKRSMGLKAKEIWILIDSYDTIDFSILPYSTCFLAARIMYFDKYQPFLDKVDTIPGLASFIKWGDTFKYGVSREPTWNSFTNYLIDR